MNVFFDVTCLMPERLSGIGVYARELYKALSERHVEISAVTKLSRLFKPSHVSSHINVSSRPFLGRIESLKGKSILQGPDFRLLSNSSRFKKIVTIHDLAVFHDGYNEEKFRSRGQVSTRKVLEQGQPDIIIVDTDTIADELASYFPGFKNRIVRVYPGANHLNELTDTFVDHGSREPYFLYVGHLEKRKNTLGVIKAFERIAMVDLSPRLVLVGKSGFGSNEIYSYIKQSRVRERIDLRGFVTRLELQSLYLGAICFVFPSFYEGFGFPILEAMSMGCPVITSNYGSMAEIAGDAAILVNPRSDESIAEGMLTMLSNSTVRNKMTVAGKNQVQGFSWDHCAQKFINLYDRL